MADQPKISEEMKKMEYEPLLPAEKKFMAFNLIIGVVLLVGLVWVSHTYFPIKDMEAQPAGQGVVQAAPAPPANVPVVPQGK
jgi:hypothetical protein